MTDLTCHCATLTEAAKVHPFELIFYVLIALVVIGLGIAVVWKVIEAVRRDVVE